MRPMAIAGGVSNNPVRATFKHIRKDKVNRDSENILITALYILIAFGLIYIILNDILNSKWIYILIFLLIVYSTRFVRMAYQDWVFPKDVIGLINFDSEFINTDNEAIKIITSDINEIHLTYNFIKGKKYHSRDIVHNGLAKIQILTKSKNEFDFIFLIESKNQLEALSEILKDYYRNQIKVNEFLGRKNVKTFLLKPTADWNYDDVQKIKSELRIKSI